MGECSYWRESIYDGRPVDVYSPDGDHLFSGMIGSTWEAARRVLVYDYEDGEQDGEPVVVCYRLVEPFE
jgi:hypothetical protein